MTRFTGVEEARYWRQLHDKVFANVRLAAFLGTLFWALFGVLDFALVTVPSAQKEMLWLRFVLGLPPLIIACGFALAPRMKYVFSKLVVLMPLWCGMVILLMMVRVTSSVDNAFVGLILTCATIYVFVPLPLVVKTSASLVLLAGYLLVAITLQTTNVFLLLNNGFFLGTANVLGFIGAANSEYLSRQEFCLVAALEQEKQRSEELLYNTLPPPIAERLKHTSEPIADSFSTVTVLFADLVHFTGLTADIEPEKLIALLNRIFTAFDALSLRYKVEKIKTIGDSYLAAAGLGATPLQGEDGAISVARLALEMQKTIRQIAEESGYALQLRIGIHTGPVIAGVIGQHRFVYDLWGDTVNVASRVESQGVAEAIHVTLATARYLAPHFTLEAQGEQALRGVAPQEIFCLIGEKEG